MPFPWRVSFGLKKRREKLQFIVPRMFLCLADLPKQGTYLDIYGAKVFLTAGRYRRNEWAYYFHDGGSIHGGNPPHPAAKAVSGFP